MVHKYLPNERIVVVASYSIFTRQDDLYSRIYFVVAITASIFQFRTEVVAMLRCKYIMDITQANYTERLQTSVRVHMCIVTEWNVQPSHDVHATRGGGVGKVSR